MSDKSSPLRRLVIEINVWVKLPEEEKYFYPIMDTHASDPTLVDCMERVSCDVKSGDGYEDVSRPRIFLEMQRFLRWVEAEMVSYEIEIRNGEDLSYRRRMLPLTYQPMAVKKTSFPEMECGGSIDISIPDAVKDQGEGLSDD
ncbi:hypothetical protein Tco_0863893 [Tanacetum coccineum]